MQPLHLSTHFHSGKHNGLSSNCSKSLPQCERNLRSKATGNCVRIKEEKYGQISYIQQKNIHMVREQCRTRWGLLPFAENYSKEKKFAKTSWLCVCGEEREEELHLLSGHCKVYGNLTHEYDNLADDNQLVLEPILVPCTRISQPRDRLLLG